MEGDRLPVCPSVNARHMEVADEGICVDHWSVSWTRVADPAAVVDGRRQEYHEKTSYNVHADVGKEGPCM